MIGSWSYLYLRNVGRPNVSIAHYLISFIRVSSDYIDILQDRPLVVPKVGVENILAIEFHAPPA